MIRSCLRGEHETAQSEVGDSRGRCGHKRDGATASSVGADVVGILDSIEIPIVVVDRDCKVTRFNRAAADVLGIGPSDIGRRPCSMQALADVPEIEQICIQVMADEVPSRHELRNGDRWFLVRISPYAGADRQVSGAVLTFTNVTAFRASLGQAIYEREYTKTILNAMIDPLVVLDDGLQVQTANRAFYDWFGVSREQTQGVPLSDLGDHDWKASGLWSSLKATLSDNREFQTIEFEGDFPNVGRRTVLLDARRLARDGTALILLAFRDITERKQAEHARRESETRFRTLFESMDEGYCVVEMIFDEKTNPSTIVSWKSIRHSKGRRASRMPAVGSCARSRPTMNNTGSTFMVASRSPGKRSVSRTRQPPCSAISRFALSGSGRRNCDMSASCSMTSRSARISIASASWLSRRRKHCARTQRPLRRR